MVLREVFKDVNIMQQAPDNLGAVSEVSWDIARNADLCQQSIG
jgi:hypothetical protein